MAPPSGTLRVGRYFLALLAIFAVLYGVVFLSGDRATPKLGIDLVGGERVIFKAVGKTDSSQMDVARQIIEERVNGNGVTGSTVQVQGTNQILVLIPNGTVKDVRDLGAAAKLNFRPLVAPAVAVTCGSAATAGAASPSASPSTSTKSSAPASSPSSANKTPAEAAEHPLTGKSTSGKKPAKKSKSTAKSAPGSSTATSPAVNTPGTVLPSGVVSPSASASPTTPTRPGTCTKDPFKSVLAANKGLKVPLVDTDFDKLTQTQQSALLAGDAGGSGAQVGGLTNYKCGAGETERDVNSNYYVVCGTGLGQDPNQEYAFLLGKVIVPGTQISDASAQAPSTAGTGGSTEWTVALNLKSSGSKAWGKYTTAHNIGSSSASASTTASATTCSPTGVAPCADFVAFTLNGEVISAPVNEEPINGGTTQISGDFGANSSKALAQKLQFGSLPLTFKQESLDSVSATLGKSQLNAALLAGGIGLALVVLYSLLYYRGLGLITIASLLVSGGLTYGMLVLLGIHLGFTLDLAGVTGFIVALGITADSFVVFFERIKDEVHEGRSLRVAVPRAWVRARRTILSADTVSFLAAAILYYFASADVQGFAFTLGLSTILDLVVVFLFTHPIVSLLSRSRAFGSPRFTGLNSVREGGIATSPDDAPRGPKRAARSSSRGAAATATVVLDKPATDANADHDADDIDVDNAAESESEGSAPGATAPSGGTAAERAAARRARMREKKADGDKDGTR